MLLIDNFEQVANQIETERGISKEVLVSAIEQALVSACLRKMDPETLLEAELNTISGEATIYQLQNVVDEIEIEAAEITLKEAQEIDPGAQVGGQIRTKLETPEFGRLAAQTAKQVILQRIREAEKAAIFEEYKDRVGEILNGTIQRVEHKNYLVNLGRTEALLTHRDQIPGERFLPKEKIRIYLADIEFTPKGSFLHISRTHPGLLQRLFELEIPEIQDGIIEIKSIAREPGKRAKIAVKSNNPSIGAVGTCVGHMGGRIQAIIKELGQEKIDVLEWNEDPKIFISNALKPAKITQVIITNDEEKTAVVVVPNDQLSLAIGKSGVNVRLSVKLTGWKLDIMNEEEYARKADEIQSINHVSIIERIKQEKERLSQETPDESESEQPSGLIAAIKASESEEETPEELTKVSDLAKMLGLKTSELMEEAKSFGVEIKSNRSKLTREDVNKIKENIS